MDLRTDKLYDAVSRAIDELQSAGIPYMKIDIPNGALDQFKGSMYGGRPEVEIRYEIPNRDTTSMYLIWDE